MDLRALVNGSRVIRPTENRLFEDLALEHEKIIWAMAYHAVRELTGRDPRDPAMQDELERELGLEFDERGRWFEILWKKEAILRVHPPEIIRNVAGQLRRRRRVEELWKKRWRVIR